MTGLFRTRLCSFAVLIANLIFATSSVSAQKYADQVIAAVAADSSGSAIVVAITNSRLHQQQVVLCSPATGQVIWQFAPQSTISSVAISPDGKTIAVGLFGVADRDLGVLLLDARSGKQMGGLGLDLDLDFMPGTVYPRYGTGVSQLSYSPDGAILYGLSNDTLFAWNVSAKKYLWTKDVPAVIEAPPELPDPLPYGHASDFALSPDGKQIAALRNALRIGAAGRTKPAHFIKRETHSMVIARATFSSDSRILAAGEYGEPENGHGTTYGTDLWIAGAIKAVHVDGCGSDIAWTGSPDIFACQNDSGSHLRNIHDPQKDIGAAGPSASLPILKVGNSLWSSSYKFADWKDPAKPLTITLVELGTGKQVKLTLPGR